jgi:hypothetical protein
VRGDALGLGLDLDGVVEPDAAGSTSLDLPLADVLPVVDAFLPLSDLALSRYTGEHNRVSI